MAWQVLASRQKLRCVAFTLLVTRLKTGAFSIERNSGVQAWAFVKVLCLSLLWLKPTTCPIAFDAAS